MTVKIDASCAVCGLIFKVDETRIKHGRGKHCSRECQYKANKIKLRRDRIDLRCIGCGKEFRLLPCQIRKSSGSGKYCTRECRDKYWVGELNPLWQGVGKKVDYGFNWQSARRAAKERDKACQNCGSEKNLHVHHIIPIRLFCTKEFANEISNLVTLCGRCHRTEEAKSCWVQFDGGVLRLNNGGIAAQLAKERDIL